jgi:hypothetical protein
MSYSRNSIDNISNVVATFDKNIYDFHSYVAMNLLIESDKSLFEEIWKKASDFKYWNYPDLRKGVENAIGFLSKEYSFQQEIANKIAWAIAYEWK